MEVKNYFKENPNAIMFGVIVGFMIFQILETIESIIIKIAILNQ